MASSRLAGLPALRKQHLLVELYVFLIPTCQLSELGIDNISVLASSKHVRKAYL